MSAFFLKHPSEEDMALFAGGELGPLARWRIERHLETCSACKAAVTDFFHLREEISPLAELPDVDWNALAESIERRVANDAEPVMETTPEPGWSPRGWQLGLAAACLAAMVGFALRSPETAPVEMDLAAVVDEAAPESVAEPVMDSAPAEPAAPRAARRAMPVVELAEAREEPVRRRSLAELEAQSASTGAQLISAASFRETPEVRLRAMQPLGSGARPGLDGVTEIRSMSDEGVFTITEVYAD